MHLENVCSCLTVILYTFTYTHIKKIRSYKCDSLSLVPQFRAPTSFSYTIP